MSISGLLSRAALLALLVPSVHAQVPRVIARHMSGVPPIGRIAWVEEIAITDGGVWALEADTTFLGSNEDGIILKDDVVQLREGDFVPNPPGTKLRFFQSLSLARDGSFATSSLLANTASFDDDGGLFIGNKLVIQEGDTPISPDWNVGTYYVWFSDVQLNANGQVLLRGFVEDPLAPGCIDYFVSLIDTDGQGNLVSERLLANELGVMPGIVDPASSIRFGPDAAALNDNGQAIFTVDLETGPDFSNDGSVWLFDGQNLSLIAREGTPSPVPGRDWGTLFRPSVSLNDNGDWVIRDVLDNSDTLSDSVIVKNGVKLVQENDVLPAIAPHPLRSFGLGIAQLTDAGDVLWYGRWSSSDQSRNEGLFLNHELIVEEGVTVAADGTLVAGLDDRDGMHYISPDGRYVIFLGYDVNGKQVVFLMDLEDPVAQFCFGAGLTANCPCGIEGRPGAGCPGAGPQGGVRLSAEGEPSLSADTMTFTVDGLPRATAMVFLQGTASSDPLPFGNGLRCTTGTLSRFGARFAEDNGATAGFGVGTDLPISAQGGVTGPGERVYQALHRNHVGFCGGAGANLSNALRVIWAP